MILTLETSQAKLSEETRLEGMRAHIAHTPWRSIVEGVIADHERKQQPLEHRVQQTRICLPAGCDMFALKQCCKACLLSQEGFRRLTWYFTEAHSGVSRPNSGSNRRIMVAFFLATSLDSLNQNQGDLIQFLVFFGGGANFVYKLCYVHLFCPSVSQHFHTPLPNS